MNSLYSFLQYDLSDFDRRKRALLLFQTTKGIAILQPAPPQQPASGPRQPRPFLKLLPNKRETPESYSLRVKKHKLNILRMQHSLILYLLRKNAYLDVFKYSFVFRINDNIIDCIRR